MKRMSAKEYLATQKPKKKVTKKSKEGDKNGVKKG